MHIGDLFAELSLMGFLLRVPYVSVPELLWLLRQRQEQ
jgi:hypothetical protein